MKKLTFGTPEPFVPSRFCSGFHYTETDIAFDTRSICFRHTPRGALLEIPVKEGTQFFGLGLQLKGINHTGRKLTLRVNADPVAYSGDSHAPVPFLVTNAGWGIYVDTARQAEFYCGVHKSNGEYVLAILIPAARGVDLYVIEDASITGIVAQYNMLAGGGCTVPAWALGVFYRCYSRYSGEKICAMADYFRSHDIPCDILGLEPGWQNQTYSCSYVFNRELYPDPDAVLGYLRQNGFHVNLWEHAFVHPSSPIYPEIRDYSADCTVWSGAVPDFSLPEARRIFADYHRKNLVRHGVDGFKLDECDSSDYTGSWSFPLWAQFPGGMDGEQYHALFGTLYMQTILQALDGTPTLSEVRNAGALAAPYPFVLYSDLYDHRDFIRGTVSAGFSGLLWTPEVRHAKDARDLLRRIQSTVFSVQCLINAWYCEEAPWLAFGSACEDKVRALFTLRKTLVPMLAAAFRRYHETGVPPVRALVMDFTDDPETYTIDDAYMFCEDLLVAPMTADQEERRCYLPAGDWIWRDFFTKEEVPSGWIVCCEKRESVCHDEKEGGDAATVLPDSYHAGHAEGLSVRDTCPRVFTDDRIPVFLRERHS